VDSGYAWFRLGIVLLLGMVGGVGMWSVVVVLPIVQKEFGVTRADASLAYTLTMLGFGFGGVIMGRMTDRYGLFRPLVAASIVLCLGYIASAHATTLWQFAIAQGLLIAMFGSAISFGPFVADTSLWFERRRGIAVAICASGNYLAGTFWPPVINHLAAAYGWRQTHLWVGLICLCVMLPLAFLVRRRAPVTAPVTGQIVAPKVGLAAVEMPRGLLQALLIVAGICCCIAMSMPQVHIVAYCGDLGYGAARGAEMLSLMLGFGIISRLISGVLADRVGGLVTLLAGSFLQMVALLLYIPFDGLMSLYIISALFGLFQGGLVPSYAIIVRENFPANEIGTRVGVTLTATLVGMAIGGWLSGVVFDLTGSYSAAFLNGVAWNMVNLFIVFLLLSRRKTRKPKAMTGAFAPA
jgi:MFS family permease